MGRKLRIAASGKGGVGKTTLATLLVKHLAKYGAVLAIDADPDSNLPQGLGVIADRTVGGVREDILNQPVRGKEGGSKEKELELALTETIQEFPDFDLVVMGPSEGPGCYCAVNYIIRRLIDSRANSYDFTVIDCHAGLEHLSRQTTTDVDIMFVVVEPTKNSVLTAKKVKELATKLCINVGSVLIVVNKVTAESKPLVDKLARENGLQVAAYLPYEPLLAQFESQGRPVMELPETSAISSAVDNLCQAILNTSSFQNLSVPNKDLVS